MSQGLFEPHLCEGLNLNDSTLITNTIPFPEGTVPYLAAPASASSQLIQAAWRNLPHCDHVHLIIDSNVRDIGLSIASELKDFARVTIDLVAYDERDKTLATVDLLVVKALDSNITRRSTIAAVGGGVVSNLGGMVAGLLFRGIPLLHFPTTLLNAFDAVLSQKQAVNLSGTKNLLGMYVLPSAIVLNFSWFANLSERHIKSGLSELYKNALATSPWQIDALNSATAMLKIAPDAAYANLLQLSIDAKAPFLKIDGKEHSSAIVFEYGHTVGHALEAQSMAQMSHGEGVAWGMLVAAELGRQFYGLSDLDFNQHEELLSPLLTGGTGIDPIRVSKLRDLISNDNKRGLLFQSQSDTEARTPMVILKALGSPVHTDSLPLVNIPISAVLDAVQSLTARELAG